MRLTQAGPSVEPTEVKLLKGIGRTGAPVSRIPICCVRVVVLGTC